jgi:hypothetical protein
MSLADDPALRAKLLRCMMLRPRNFLAAALAEWPDEDLAALIDANPHTVWRLRIRGWPRHSNWAADVRQLAALVDGDATRLGRLLDEVRVQP